jgi:hypothetical protein
MFHRGPYRPLTDRDLVVAELVESSIAQANECIERRQFREALFDLDTAIGLMPTLPQAHFNKAHALLSLGEYVEGFREFEWRLPLLGDPLASSGVPLWRGQSLSGRHLLLCHEYGYGDSLMLLRYVPVLQALGAVVTLLLPPALIRFARALDVEIRDEYPAAFEGFDYRCQMFSVVTNLRHGVGDIPAAPPIAIERIGESVPDTIGIGWSGNRAHGRDRHRSIEVEHFLALLKRDGRALMSVQDGELDQASACGVVTRPYRDFAEAASWMIRLEHVVTVDTAAAHLAGVIGHPSAHVLVPYASDWRWYNAAAWYPNLTVHRQDRPGDWASAFAGVNRCLNA